MVLFSNLNPYNDISLGKTVSKLGICSFQNPMINSNCKIKKKKNNNKLSLRMHAKSLQSYPILCSPMGCSPPGSSVLGILQARILEWTAISFIRGSSQPGIKARSLTSPSLTGKFFTTSTTGKPSLSLVIHFYSSLFLCMYLL